MTDNNVKTELLDLKDKLKIKKWLDSKLQISEDYRPLNNDTNIKQTVKNTGRCFESITSIWLFNLWFNAAFFITILTIYLMISIYGSPFMWMNYIAFNYHNTLDLALTSKENCQGIATLEYRMNVIKNMQATMNMYSYNNFENLEKSKCYYTIKASNPSFPLKLYNNGTKKYITNRGTLSIPEKVLNLIQFYVDQKNLKLLAIDNINIQNMHNNNNLKFSINLDNSIKDGFYRIQSPIDKCPDDNYCFDGIQEGCCRTNVGIMPLSYWSNFNKDKLCQNPLIPCYACERGLEAVPAGIIYAFDRETKLMAFVCSGIQTFKDDLNDRGEVIYNMNNDEEMIYENDDDEEDYNNLQEERDIIFLQQENPFKIDKNMLNAMDHKICMSGRGAQKYLHGKCICKLGWAGLNCDTKVGICKSLKEVQERSSKKNAFNDVIACDNILKITNNDFSEKRIMNISSSSPQFKNSCANNNNNAHSLISYINKDCKCECCFTDIKNGVTYCGGFL